MMISLPRSWISMYRCYVSVAVIDSGYRGRQIAGVSAIHIYLIHAHAESGPGAANRKGHRQSESQIGASMPV